MKRTFIAAGFAALTLIAGCSSGSDRSVAEDLAKANGMSDAEFLACEDYINGRDDVDADDTSSRVEFARTVNEWAAQSRPDLKDAGEVLARAANTNAEGWPMGTGTFEQACLRAGWPTQQQIDDAK
ncbi:hypothetical protein [Rhodococcoides fascians]|uniref:hypothetical protein n=1 Tax=Rhodococcoides fascians TaxID=1828 RepID=UPI0005683C16|nr:hypothetical protein [Rhodococcus fascians]